MPFVSIVIKTTKNVEEYHIINIIIIIVRTRFEPLAQKMDGLRPKIMNL